MPALANEYHPWNVKDGKLVGREEYPKYCTILELPCDQHGFIDEAGSNQSLIKDDEDPNQIEEKSSESRT